MAEAENQVKDFPNVVPQADVTANRKVTHLTIWREAARTNFMGKLDITDSAVVKLGQAVRLPAGIISFTIPTPTNGSAYTATEAVKGITDDGVYVDAHYGDPGSANDMNRLSSIGQANIGGSEWTHS